MKRLIRLTRQRALLSHYEVMPDMDRTACAAPGRTFRGNPEIEYLRAFAMVLVIIMHSPLLYVPFSAGGLQRVQDWIHPATGVDLFFVISGYLMGRSFVGPYEAGEHDGNQVTHIAAFWVRRFYRLFPALSLWIGLTLVASVFFAGSVLWIPPHAMFFKGLASLMSVRNFEESWAPSHFGYVWSLSVENQFYLLLPLFLLTVARRWRIAVMLGLCVLNALWRPGGEEWWLFRYDGLVYGVLLFELERTSYARTLAQCIPSSLVGRIGFMVCAVTVLVTSPLVLIHFHPLAWTLVNWAGAVLVFAASFNRGTIVIPFGLRRAALWIGARSYSLYLCHIPVWTFVLELMQRSGLGSERFLILRFLAALLLTLIAAHLTYTRVELPLQARGRKVAAKLRQREDVGRPSTN